MSIDKQLLFNTMKRLSDFWDEAEWGGNDHDIQDFSNAIYNTYHEIKEQNERHSEHCPRCGDEFDSHYELAPVYGFRRILCRYCQAIEPYGQRNYCPGSWFDIQKEKNK